MKIISKNFKTKTEKFLTKDKSVLIIGHFNPDGDTTGGSLGLYLLLKNAGYNVKIMMPSELADFLKWIPGANEIIYYDKDIESEIINHADIIFYIDFNDIKRTEYLEDALNHSKAIKIMLDHHPQPVSEVDLIYSDTEMSSASEIVYKFIEIAGFEKYMNKEIATCIYTGIMTDTLNFSVNSSRPETFETVAKLLAYGIDKDDIYDKVNNNFSLKRLKLVGYLLYEKMKVISDNTVSYILISKEELREFDFKSGDHEGIVNMPLSVSEIGISIIAIENENFIKISLRSKGDYDVNLLSKKYFNGGGHKNAAGGRIYKPYSETEKYIVDSINNFFNN